MAAAAIAAVMAMLGKLSSAAGGWGEIPNDQLAMVHKQEMVLPAKFAAPLREMLMGGGWNANASIAAALASINALNASAASRMNRLGEMSLPFDRLSAVNNGPVSQDIQIGQRGRGGENFEGAGNADGRGGETHIHIHAIDARSFEQYLKNNRNALVRNIKGAARDNAFFS